MLSLFVLHTSSTMINIFSLDFVHLVFVGSPLLNITAKSSPDILVKYNLESDGCVQATDKHKDLLENLFKDSNSHLSAGGSALNSARIAKWVLGEKGEVSFFGSVGEDKYAKWINNTLQSEGVISLCITSPGVATGICACLLTDQGERSMITQQGAAANLSIEYLKMEHFIRKMNEANCVFIVGYLLSYSPKVVHSLVDTLLEKQMFSLSLSAEYICRQYANDIIRLIPRVDILFGNEVEMLAFAETLSSQKPMTVTTALNTIKQLKKLSTSHSLIIVVTRGRKPVLVDDGLDSLKYFKVPGNIPVVDSTGCGDAFAGAFVAKYEQTNSLSTSVEAGIRAATKMAQIKGCDPPSEKFDLF